MNKPVGKPEFKWGIVATEFAVLFWLVAVFTDTLFSPDMAPDILPAMVCIGLGLMALLSSITAFVRPVPKDQKVYAVLALVGIAAPLVFMLVTEKSLY